MIVLDACALIALIRQEHGSYQIRMKCLPLQSFIYLHQFQRKLLHRYLESFSCVFTFQRHSIQWLVFCQFTKFGRRLAPLLSSTGVTCFVCCLRTAKNARSCVPQLYRGVCCFFDFVEKTTNPTRMGSVREPGSLTHPQVTPIEPLLSAPFDVPGLAIGEAHKFLVCYDAVLQ